MVWHDHKACFSDLCCSVFMSMLSVMVSMLWWVCCVHGVMFLLLHCKQLVLLFTDECHINTRMLFNIYASFMIMSSLC